MKPTELRQINQNEVRKSLRQKRERLRELRFGLSAGKVKNVREIRAVRKDIARILTILEEGKTESK